MEFVTFIIIRETPGYKLPLAPAPYCFITRALCFVVCGTQNTFTNFIHQFSLIDLKTNSVHMSVAFMFEHDISTCSFAICCLSGGWVGRAPLATKFVPARPSLGLSPDHWRCASGYSRGDAIPSRCHDMCCA